MNNNTNSTIKNLEILLADYYIVAVKTQNFHWNVEDARFSMLHELFGKQYEEMIEAIDEIAERIRTLGAYAPASMKKFLKLGTLKEEAESPKNSQAMIKILRDDHQKITNRLRHAIENLATSDQGTADLLTQHLQAHEKIAWILNSHIEH